MLCNKEKTTDDSIGADPPSFTFLSTLPFPQNVSRTRVSLRLVILLAKVVDSTIPARLKRAYVKMIMASPAMV